MGSNFTFAHLADCHLGAWRDEKMRQIGFDSFAHAIHKCIHEKVAFILIAGDLFNTALPAFDILKDTFALFREVKHAGIPIYFIAGSHDYSTAGKTMLHLLEEAELATNVLKGDVVDGKLKLNFIIDEKTGTKMCGILGRAQALEKSYYEMLDRASLEQEDGFKIFLFHTAISEIKPEGVGSFDTQLSYLPKGFNYYAGGHVHFRFNQKMDQYGQVVYPGPTFPNSFSEVEELKSGSFMFVDVTDNELHTRPQFISLKPVKTVSIRCDGKTPAQVESELEDISDVKDAILTIRIAGKLDGLLSDIDFQSIISRLYADGAYMVMKNTTAIETDEFVAIAKEDDAIEETLITENLTGTIGNQKEEDIAFDLLHRLDTSKQDGEVVADYEERVISEVEKLLR